MKKYLYTLLTFSLLGLNYANAAQSYGENKVDSGLKGSNEGADSAIQTLIKNAMMFLYLVAVVYGLWGGFQILTAGGKDDQVKKGRTIIVQALIGLIVIWLASSIVQFLITSILGVNN